MDSIRDRDAVVEVFDALDGAVQRCTELSFDALTTPERLNLLERIERVRRRLPVAEHQLINQLARLSVPAELGGRLSHCLADRLLITRGEANRRIGDAADLGERHTFTGQPLEPLLAGSAAAQREGAIGAAAVRVIRDFWHRLPAAVDPVRRENAEADLAKYATEFRPDQLSRLADKLADCLNPDGSFTDDDRARRRGLTLGSQDIDGMSRLVGYLTPEARATIEAVLARLAAPGMCNPDDETPTLDGTPSLERARGDTRSAAQRNHDALTAMGRALLASGQLGQHNGLPAAIIVSTTLADLQAKAGTALTGGGSLLPMSDVIRLARHANHYLAIFDGGKAIGLYHTKRLASPGQRIVLYAKDRGCSYPGCDVPGYFCEVHHCTDYSQCGESHIDDLTFGCGSHHPLASTGGWKTRKRRDGTTEWIPPAHLDHGRPRTNTYHHPEKLLRPNNEDDDGP